MHVQHSPALVFGCYATSIFRSWKQKAYNTCFGRRLLVADLDVNIVTKRSRVAFMALAEQFGIAFRWTFPRFGILFRWTFHECFLVCTLFLVWQAAESRHCGASRSIESGPSCIVSRYSLQKTYTWFKHRSYSC